MKILALFLIFVSTQQIGYACAASTVDWVWEQQLIAWLGESPQLSNCPTPIYEAEIIDKAILYSSQSDPYFEPKEFESWQFTDPSEQDSKLKLKCYGVHSKFQINCQESGIEKLIDLLPPYRTNIDAPLRIEGGTVVTKDQSFDIAYEFVRSWVPYDQLAEEDRAQFVSIYESLRANKCDIKTSETTCERYDLIRNANKKMGAVAKCSHSRIGDLVGPPKRGSCVGMIAVVKDRLWVLATTRVYRPRRTKIDILSSLCNMFYSIDFEEQKMKSSVLNTYDSFIEATIRDLIKSLELPPWDISSLEYNDQSRAFKALSGRRKSKIVSTYEDLYIHVIPTVRIQTSKASELHPHAQIGQDDILLSRLLRIDDHSGIDLSIIIEIYLSKYNTLDDSYWIRPTKEQEVAYRTAMKISVEEAAAKACEQIGMNWWSSGVHRPVCAAKDTSPDKN